jgi:hypothetical protein
MNLYRSLSIERQPDESLLKILEQLAREGYLQNNRYLDVEFDCSSNPRFVEVICSMKNLKILFGRKLTLEDLAHVFESCSKITNLFIPANGRKMSEMAEHLKNQLRSGFQRLRYLDLKQIDNDSWPVIQEMLTYVNRCQIF